MVVALLLGAVKAGASGYLLKDAGPDQIAEGLNISKIPIVLALVALVGVGLITWSMRARRPG